MSRDTPRVRFRDASVADPDARTLLAEYFASRRETFPGPGEYVTTWPDPERFAPPDGVFLVVEREGSEQDGAAQDGGAQDGGGSGRRSTARDAAARAGIAVGCGGIRSVEAPEGVARFEVKHLWLRPDARGAGVGRALLRELERRARDLGGTELVLDTNDSLAAAGGLYRSSGFETIPPYNDNRNANHWYGKRL